MVIGKQLWLWPSTSILVATLLPSSLQLNTPSTRSFKAIGLRATTSLRDERENENGFRVRIGIIGGGIAGVSVAHALRKRDNAAKYRIQVLEAGIPGMTATHLPTHPEEMWKAATDRNGNSIVPGASFHIFSKPSSLFQVLSDTFNEFWKLRKESLFGKTHFDTAASEFLSAPPYFALNLTACLGPTASTLERQSFFRFVRNYLYFTFLESGGAKERGKHMCKIAKANRNLYLRLVNSDIGNNVEAPMVLPNSIGHSQGFISVHRSIDEAKLAVDLVKSMGEEAELLTWEDAIKFEPRIQELPISPLFVVRRSNDFTSSCGECVRQLSQQGGFSYQTGAIVESIERKDDVFSVRARNGATFEYDVLVLASGVHTPLQASQLGVAKYCPTYPLRGFSLTVFAGETDPSSSGAEPSYKNLLRQPFKVDSMYCTSVTPRMARWVGFGELVGFPHPDNPLEPMVPSVAPAILARYARSVFPDCTVTESEQKLQDSVLPCYRALSPDDLPIVGAVAEVPGLFLHTGHGSLGWTLGWATGDLLAAQIHRHLQSNSEPINAAPTEASGSSREAAENDCLIQLSDGTMIDPSVVSPERFVWRL
jgi:glycine/D-amino acid oxidase-like deaminating enzyme